MINSIKIQIKQIKADKIFMIFLAIFVFKGFIYASFINPPTLSTAPDDVGHLSYIQYIVHEAELPIMHEANMETKTLELHFERITSTYNMDIENLYYDFDNIDFSQESHPNWITQHPPLYYSLAAIVYAVASLFTSNSAFLIIAVRLLSVLFGAVTLIYLRKLLILKNINETLRNFAYSLFVFSFSITYFFANITNDSLLIALSGIAFYYLMKFFDTFDMKDCYKMVILSALIMCTKYTGGLVVLGFVLVFLYKVITTKPFKQAIAIYIKSATLGILALAPLFIYNFITYGSILVTYGGDFGVNENAKSFAFFILRTEYILNIVHHIVQLAGWGVTIRADNFNLFLTAVILAVIAAILIKTYYKSKIKNIAVLLTAIFSYSLVYYISSNILVSLIVCLVGVIAVGVVLIMGASKKEFETNIFSLVIIAVVFIGFLYTHYSVFTNYSTGGALHGRYYYPLILPAFYLLTNSLRKADIKTQKVAVVISFAVCVINEAGTILRAFEVWPW